MHSCRRWSILAGLLLPLVAVASCTPADDMISRTDRLPADVRPVVRDAIWAHGNPFNWSAQNNVVIDCFTSDYRHGFNPLQSHKIYTIDLKGRAMRIDDESTQTVSVYDGGTWRVFVRGKEMKLPSRVNSETVGYFAMYEYAAGEMRSIRFFFCLPFDLLGPGLTLSSLGAVQSAGGGNEWNVAKVLFDPASTGHLRGDKAFVYVDPVSRHVDRLLFTLADAPFHGIPHWGEWSDYRRMTNGLIMPYRLDFRMTDDDGAADLGRRFTVLVDRIAFNVRLPSGCFNSADARPGPVEDQSQQAAAIRGLQQKDASPGGSAAGAQSDESRP